MHPINDSTSSGIFPWRPACWLRVTGPDAATFLQGQFTNDLRALEGAPAVYGLWLSLKGKVVADSFVLGGRSPGEFWIASYASPAALIGARLESHVIADDVTVDDFTSEWMGISMFGDAAQAGSAMPAGENFVFPGRRTRPPNSEWVFPLAQEPACRARLSLIPEVDAATVMRLRIEAAIPAVPTDLGPGDLPNEAGLEAEAISYTKGCYLGQEVMARLKSMGQVRRRLLRVRGADPNFPALPAPLFAASRQVGELRSAVAAGEGFIGLAMVSLLHVNSESRLAFSGDAPGDIRLVP